MFLVVLSCGHKLLLVAKMATNNYHVAKPKSIFRLPKSVCTNNMLLVTLEAGSEESYFISSVFLSQVDVLF